MLNTKEYFNQLESTLAVKELDNETAAIIQGGYDLIAYSEPNGKGVLGSFNLGSPKLSTKGNNKISSVRINKGVWRLYNFFNYNTKGGYETLGPNKPGEVWNLNRFDNKTSSLRKIG
ncbi:MAG: hypothetical protein V7K18_20650 [Nostoc sp.]|uniref:hypothetical protein n=1 Tax=Nostoc sp. TaxID=1180 RepID=UPI002FF5B773